MTPALAGLFRAHLRSWDTRRAATFAFAVASVLIAILYLWPGARTFSIFAETHGLTITFDGTVASAWRFPKMSMCRRLPSPLPPAARQSLASRCDPRLFEEHEFVEPVEILWPAGTTVELFRGEAGSDLEVRILSYREPPTQGELTIGKGSLLFVPSNAWARSGTIIYSGEVVLGAAASPGERGILLSGAYEVRHRPFLQNDSVLLRSGTLFAGDRVDMVTADDEPARNVYGFVAPRDDEPGLRATILTPASFALLRIDRLGAEPARIGPSWIDRAVTDPVLVAIPILLVFANYGLAILGFVLSGTETRRRGRHEG